MNVAFYVSRTYWYLGEKKKTKGKVRYWFIICMRYCIIGAEKKFNDKEIIVLTADLVKKGLKVGKLYNNIKYNFFFHVREHVKDNKYVVDIFTYDGSIDHELIKKLAIYSPGFKYVDATISSDEQHYYFF